MTEDALKSMFESIQTADLPLLSDKEEVAMHPVNYQDIYRNGWRIGSANSSRRRGRTGPWIRDLRFLVERKCS
ncbi:hypothetical protein FJV80_11200 [Mesorhizobium sp. WSM4310]|nr:hypothetical protein FJV80_11200 [Mesorhizobium sp. WSM4310]